MSTMIAPDYATGFLTLFAPQIEDANARLTTALAEVNASSHGLSLPDPQELAHLLFADARRSLEAIILPTMVLELNVARLRGELAGTTPEERYAHFQAQLQRPEVSNGLSEEYPALFDLVQHRLDMWVGNSVELVERLIEDWQTVRATLIGGGDPGPLRGVRAAQRSTKRGGRAVVLLTFDSGARVVYKPRSLEIEARFAALVTWLNGAGFAPALRPPSVLDRGEYGWMEFVAAEPCATEAELTRFYRRQGAYLALFYVLEATDIHMSNIIAAGEHPMFIDLEALFHPRSGNPDWPALDLALDDIAYYSVLRSGLLPEPESLVSDEPDRLDESGLAGAGGQISPLATPTWQDKLKDTMHLSHQRKVIGHGKNLPFLRGEPVEPLAYLDALDQGFVDAYQRLAAHRHQLLAPGGAIAAFRGAGVRVICRSGHTYGKILDNSYHPDLLREPSSRAAYLEKQLHGDASDDTDLSQLIPYELADLVAGDVPAFATRVGSTDLSSAGGDSIPGYVTSSSFELVRQRMQALSESDLEQQRWFIRASFATIAPDNAPVERPGRQSVLASPHELSAGALRQAVEMGERLTQTAIHAGNETSWLGLEPDEFLNWSIEPLAGGLGYGLPGVALFLFQLGHLTGERRWHDLGQRTTNTWLRQLAEEMEDELDPEEPVGLVDGIGGRLYALAHMAPFVEPAVLRPYLDCFVERAAEALDQATAEEDPSLADGVAGCLTGLLAAHKVAPESGALAAATLAGDWLLHNPQVRPEAMPASPAHFLYGAAGGAGPLLALSVSTGREAYRRLALDQLQAVLDDDGMNEAEASAFLLARPWLEAGTLRQAVDARLRGLLPDLVASQDRTDHTPGGRLGRVDMMLTAATLLRDRDLREAAGQWAAVILDELKWDEPRPATPLLVETPGFLTGLAGVGYGLLRLARPLEVPAFPALPTQLGRSRR